MGIDRITMLLTDSNNIKEVMLFPAMKPNDGGLAKAEGKEAPKAITGGAAKPAPAAAFDKNVQYFTTSSGQYLPNIVANFTGHEITNTLVGPEEVNKKDQSNIFPYIKTTSGQTVAEVTAIAAHLAR